MHTSIQHACKTNYIQYINKILSGLYIYICVSNLFNSYAHQVIPESPSHERVSFLTEMKTVWREIGTVRPPILKEHGKNIKDNKYK